MLLDELKVYGYFADIHIPRISRRYIHILSNILSGRISDTEKKYLATVLPLHPSR